MTTEVIKPAKMDPETVKKLEEAFALDCTVEEAAFYAGITKQTLYNWMKSFPDLKERFYELKNHPVILARTTVVAALQKSPMVALEYLRKKRKDEFGHDPKQKEDETLNKIQVEIITSKNNEQNDKIEIDKDISGVVPSI